MRILILLCSLLQVALLMARTFLPNTPSCFVAGFVPPTFIGNYYHHHHNHNRQQRSLNVNVHSQFTQLHAKQKRKKNRKVSKGKNSTSKNYVNVDAGMDDVTSTSTAAGRPMAILEGVKEDHNYEQFFYSDESTRRIYQLVTTYNYPVLLCNPSLAVMAEKDDDNDTSYLLLDRDDRFNFLKGYKEFSLTEPFLVDIRYKYDAIFVDPPFANVSPSQLVKCIRLMGSTEERHSAPIFIAYNSKREEELVKAFDELPCPTLTRLFRLNYRSVREDMQDHIYLYGPGVL